MNKQNTRLADYLTPRRVVVDLHVSSKKRSLEEIASLLVRDNAGLNKDTVFQTLVNREKLGSTGIGHGVALPHGRLNGIDEPITAVARLQHALDFDAIDQEPVSLIIGLLVPPEANQTHLNLLAQLAKLMADENFRNYINESSNADELFERLTKSDDGSEADEGG